METTYIRIEQAFDTTHNDRIILKKRSVLHGILLLVAGILCILLIPFAKTESGTVSALLITMALIFVITGMLATFIRRTFYFFVPTQSKILFKDVFFEHSSYQKIKKCIETDSYIDLAKTPQSIDNGVKLRIAYTPDAELCMIQLFGYVPYEYVARTAIKELTKQQSRELFRALVL
jgi:uncharacterized membrane protein (DUF485 family)